MRTEFDGQIQHQPPFPGASSWKDGSWVDQWWGPGGYLVITNQTDTRSRMSKGAVETLHRPDGTTSVKHHLLEGMDYKHLPELFGSELWAQRHKEGHVAPV